MTHVSVEADPREEASPQLGISEGGRLSRLKRYLVGSEPLPESSWRVRHHFVVGLALAHVPVLFALGVIQNGDSVAHSGAEAMAIVTMALGGLSRRLGRRGQELLGTLALLTCSAVLVHVTGGSTEAHFHFFVVLPVVSLYQSWPAFLMALGYVLVHHGLLGQISPEAVYNHPAAIASPWRWAAIHAFFVSAASAVFVVMWRHNAMARNEARDLYRRLYEGERAIVQQLETASRMKDELVGVVSHELRTPLTSILGFGELLRDSHATDEDRKVWLERLLRQGDRLQFLVENLLNVARAHNQKDGSSDVKSVLAEVLSQESDCPEGPGAIKDDVPEGLITQTPGESLRLILANLVNNAAKHGMAGTPICINAWLEPDENGRCVAITVTNRSNAIDAADHERIFDAFVQLDSSITRRVPGVGLGLHIVRETVEAHGGSVEVKSAGNDVTFVVRLPAANVVASDDTTAA